MRKIKFKTGEYYHVYNRGVDKREIFSDKYDYIRFLESLNLFNSVEAIGSIYELGFREKRIEEAEPPIGGSASNKTSPLVEIVSYSLLPNHFHLLLKQKEENGISEFMHRIGGYTLFYNKKYKRSGSLFQGPFQLVYIDSESYLNYISAYIHGNAEIHKIENAENYIWSSYQDYLGKREGVLCNKKTILDEFDSIQEYREYVDEVIKDSSQIKEDKKKYVLE